MSKNILLVDKRVEAYETIVSAVNPELCVPIVFDYYTETVETLKEKIRSQNISGSTHIGLVQHNDSLPHYRLFASSTGSRVFNVAVQDPTLETWSELRDFISWCKTTPEVNATYFDMMACALYSDTNWKYVIDTLTTQTGVTIRASTDDTGASSEGGDWFLESHMGVNLKDVYFTEAVEEYSGLLLRINTFKYAKSYDFKGFATGSVITWGASNYGGNSSVYDVNTTGYTSVASSLSSGVVSVHSAYYAVAALKSNGSVVTWGESNTGGDSSSVSSSLTSGVVAVYSTEQAFAVLKSDGSVVTWGISNYGGDSSLVSSSLASGVVEIYAASLVFAALKNDGSVVTWGDPDFGVNFSNSVASSLQSGVVQVYYTYYSLAFLKNDGSVISSYSGGNSLNSGVVSVYSTMSAFAALKNDGSVITWGDSGLGGDSNYPVSNGSSLNSGVVAIYSNDNAFAALKSDGSVVTWGDPLYGGDSSTVSSSLQSGVVSIYSNPNSFAALKIDGSVVTWGFSSYGGSSTAVSSSLTSGVVAIYSTLRAYAALKSNGSVVTWGLSGSGGNSSTVSSSLQSGVVAVYSTQYAFAALKNNGSVITWGSSSYGANSSSVSSSLTSGVIGLSSTYYAFAALKTSASTFDLSGSLYSDMDRYNILRNKETRRCVNLTTLNNNVFTLSSSRDLQKLNPAIPAGKTLTIIVPTYVASSYSITSTATLP
jgi:hypothetical protein